MKRRSFLIQSALALPSLDLIAKSLFVDPCTIKMRSKTTGIFSERGGTILFKFTKKGIVVIDSKFPVQANHLIN